MTRVQYPPAVPTWRLPSNPYLSREWPNWQSTHIAQRLKQHKMAGRVYTHFGFVPVPADLMLSMEIAYIHALRPPLNLYIEEPKYLQHDKIVAAIQERWAKNVPLLPIVAGDLDQSNAERAAT